jgi:hypothetical protein
MKKLGLLALAIIGVVSAAGYGWYRHQYPYGWSHCCLKGLGLSLLQYAREHEGRFPAGAGCPEASLSLLYRWNRDCGDAEVLRGKTVPVERVRGILERGELLGPETCGWHYVEGLTTSDDSGIAIIWDKVGLGHNGEDIGGGHSVWFLHGPEEVIPASDWPKFLKRQQQLMAARPQDTEEPQRAAAPHQPGG